MKKIISSGVMLLAVAAVLIGGTGAFFSDTETSTGNVFTAGAIDLMINHTAQTYNGVSCQTCGVTIYSSTDTRVVGASAGATSAGDVPKDAELVANPNPAWLDAATIAPAEWIWVTPVVDVGDTTNDAEYTFEDTFFLQGPIALTDFELEIASDNGYKIVVNGTTIVDRLNVETTYTGLNPLDATEQAAFQAALIQNGQNSLQITVRNMSGIANPSQNPAGLIYKIEFTNEDCAAGVADFQATCELWQSTDLTNQSFFNFSDIKPQDSGTNLISMTVENNESYVCLRVDEDEDASVLGNDGGDMGEYLQVMGWYADSDGDITDNTPAFGPTAANNLGSITYSDSNNSPVTPGETQYLLLEWCMGDMTVSGTDVSCDGNVPNINDTQAAQFVADLQFYVVQSRNNADFQCADADFGDENDGGVTEDDSIVVTPNNLQGWFETNVRVDGSSDLTDTQPDQNGGTGSLEQTSTGSGDKTDYRLLQNFGLISELTNLSFDWYRDSSSTAPGHLTPAFGIFVEDSNGDSWLLKWEGVYNGYPSNGPAVPTDMWTTEDLLTANYWRIPQVQGGSFVGFGGCNQAGDPYQCFVFNRTLQDAWLTGYEVVGLETGIGSGWAGTFTSFVDAVTINGTEFDFEN